MNLHPSNFNLLVRFIQVCLYLKYIRISHLSYKHRKLSFSDRPVIKWVVLSINQRQGLKLGNARETNIAWEHVVCFPYSLSGVCFLFISKIFNFQRVYFLFVLKIFIFPEKYLSVDYPSIFSFRLDFNYLLSSSNFLNSSHITLHYLNFNILTKKYFVSRMFIS